LPIIKRKLVGVFFESKEIRPKINFKNRIDGIKKDNKPELKISKLEEHKNNKKDELIDQNNNSNISILNINKLREMKYITDKNLNKDNSKKYNDKIRFSLKEGIPKLALKKKGLFNYSIRNTESLSFYENFRTDKPKNKYNKHKMKYIFPYYYFFLDFIFDKLMHPEKFLCLPKTYFIVYNYMCQIYDISSHIKLFRQVNILKKMMFENKKYESEDEIRSIKKSQKINIRHSKSIEQLGKDLKYRSSVIFSNDLF
jgi:hypothetical protein